MRGCRVVLFGLSILAIGMLGASGPVATGARSKQADAVAKLTPESFRCILVGDSQTTTPGGNRIRTQFHSWDAPIVGDLITIGNSVAGYRVLNSDAGVNLLSYQLRSMVAGWGDHGPHDFFARWGAQWTCGGDINAPGARVGRYQLNFGESNTDAPWDNPWGVGVDLVAKIAVRTSPGGVGLIETRAERGAAVDSKNRRVHVLSQEWGVQIIEQPISASIDPKATMVGVGIFFPDGAVELKGQKLEVLGVLIARVDHRRQVLDGTIVGYHGMSGWSMFDHIFRLTTVSRAAMVEMIDPKYVMIMLGHNMEPGGAVDVRGNTNKLVRLWEDAFAVTGRRRPTFIFVAPWVIFFDVVTPYLVEIESSFIDQASLNKGDLMVNYIDRFERRNPDLHDPSRYQLDAARVHPGDIPTAVNLSEDLYQMLFYPNRVPE